VNYALENNISVKQTELDIKSSSIDKKAAIGNSSFTKCITFLNIGLNQDITTGLLVIKQRSTSAGASIELIFIKVYRIKTH
jgi:outer membrane protein